MTLPRVYLDQHGWIRLAKAALGRPESPEHAAAWEVVGHGVSRGLVSCPLSIVHYMETLRIPNMARRRRLGTVMTAVSRFHTIASPTKIVEMEIDHAVRDTFGRDFDTREVQIFGVGFEHAFGYEPGVIKYPQSLTPHQRRTIEDQVNAAILVGLPANDQVWKKFHGPDAFAASFAKREEELADHVAAIGYDRGDALRRYLMVDSIEEILDRVNDSMRRARVPHDPSTEFDAEGLTAFFNRIHSRRVVRELRTVKHPQRQKAWEPNDLQDLAAMGVGVVYCDIVLAEKQWADAIHRTKLDTTYGTIVIDSLADLPEAIVTATSLRAA